MTKTILLIAATLLLHHRRRRRSEGRMRRWREAANWQRSLASHSFVLHVLRLAITSTKCMHWAWVLHSSAGDYDAGYEHVLLRVLPKNYSRVRLLSHTPTPHKSPFFVVILCRPLCLTRSEG